MCWSAHFRGRRYTGQRTFEEGSTLAGELSGRSARFRGRRYAGRRACGPAGTLSGTERLGRACPRGGPSENKNARNEVCRTDGRHGLATRRMDGRRGSAIRRTEGTEEKEKVHAGVEL